jgi:8-oxo-dGTP pyrophosphatase MutT (NUDIX family)
LVLQPDIIRSLATKLSQGEPVTSGPMRAAVSVILDRAIDPRVLLIQRADREGDPWSGQVAFPGGKFEDGDSSARATAVREAREEVGIELDTEAEFLGYYVAFRTHTGNMDVIPALFLLKEEAEVRINEEAKSYKWVGLKALAAQGAGPARASKPDGDPRTGQAYTYDGYVVWGLTHQIISSLLS